MAVYQIYEARATLAPQRRILKLFVAKVIPKIYNLLVWNTLGFQKGVAENQTSSEISTYNPHGYPTGSDPNEPCQVWSK
jgi:hypothetical protein